VFTSGHARPETWCKSCGYYPVAYDGAHRDDCVIFGALAPRCGKNYPHNDYDKRCVVARRHAFEHVSWDNVQRIFAASQVFLIAENLIVPRDPG